jgi:Putative MetA-pathway of phenol degradation
MMVLARNGAALVASGWSRFGSARRAAQCVAVALVLLTLVGTPDAEPDRATPPAFFDPVVTIAPGITHELALLAEHTRDGDSRRTQASIRLQYPLLSWVHLSLEMPVVVADLGGESPTTGAGDLIVGGQAMVWTAGTWPAEVDLGFELTLPTGGSDVLAGSTALRPFVAAGTKLGPLDLIGNLSYEWALGGTFSGTQLFQATAAVGYPTRWIAPFVELSVVKPVRGSDELRPQTAVLRGIELFLPWKLSLSVGVQLPLGPARFFDQRVFGFLKRPF